MTGQVGESASPLLDGRAVRTLLAVAAAAGGMTAAWLADGRIVVLAAMAMLLAAGNGYGKAYSP